jgi:hypothetical protein
VTDQVHLYVIEMNPERARALKVELAHLPQVTVFERYADAVAASGGLDAIFVPLMSALEWGAIKIPAPLHQTQVVTMPGTEVTKGRPRFAIPGVATSPGESLNPVDATRLVLRESLTAIHRFNETSPIKLKAVAAPSGSLGLDKLKAGQARELLSSEYLLSVA